MNKSIRNLTRFPVTNPWRAGLSAQEKREKTNVRGMLGKVLAATICLSALAVPSLAPAADGYAGGKARVNKSAGLRAQTEFLASSSCRLDAGIDAAAARADLIKARKTFENVLSGLEHGDPMLGIPTAESRPKSLVALKEVSGVLASMNSALDNLASGFGKPGDANSVEVVRASLRDKTFVLASEISGQYSDPDELLQSDAITLDFAGRQLGLAHRIARTACQLYRNPNDHDARDELKETVALLENSLDALQNGYPAAAISAPPTDAVRESLNAAYLHWSEARPLYNEMIAGAKPSEDDVMKAADFAVSFGKEMNNAITLYLIASPGQDGVYRVPLEEYARTQLSKWLKNEELLAALRAQNVANAGITEDQVIALDLDWRAQKGEGGGELTERLMSHPVSVWLKDKQDATTGFVTEVFVMDNKGLNVAQSEITSDYWQGDEAKWQQTYLAGPNALHISEVEFDDSTGYYQSQASMTIIDPTTNEPIGAITFGINVQSLM